MRIHDRAVDCSRLTVWRAARAVALAALVFLSACSTQPAEPGSYYRTAQTEVSLESTPSGTVNVDNRYVGITPVTFPLEYEQEVERDTKNVTYWQTQPGLAVFLTVMSLGIYLPFSFIPADSETTLVPQEVYRSNHFQIAVDAPGYEQWRQEVDAKGEKSLQLKARLVKKAEH